VLRGDTDMNCSLCKYRAQVLGFERDVGAPQQSHHHHVEGLVESCTLCERECTGACQSDGVPLPLADSAHSHTHEHGHGHEHGHSHAPYPHADHPLGPRSLRQPSGSVSHDSL
jgi:sirohydrochlorin cobaltochelatase